METIETGGERETEAAGERIARRLRAGDVVALYGELGAGKTALVRGIARGLGIEARVFSPTFTVVNEYDGAVPLLHFDMYRLASADEAWDIGWEDYLERGGVCVVEWSENVEELFDSDAIRIRLCKTGGSGRRLTVENLRAGEAEE